ncbi:MAG: TetR/AcrR family transcriptional regulator [Verrucomicrobiota bacterium]
MDLLVSKRPPSAALGRPREFDEEKVLAAAARTFWEHGYHETSIEVLCEATGLLRGSLYSAYGDKKGILMAALAHYSEGRVARLARSLRKRNLGRNVLREGLLYYVQTASDLERARACFITNTALELTPQDPGVAQLVERVFRRMAALWTEAALRARDEGFFDLKLDAMAAGNYLLCVAQGLRVLGKIYREKELTDMVDMALRALEERPAQSSKA